MRLIYISILLLISISGCTQKTMIKEPEILPGAYQIDLIADIAQGKRIGVVVNHASMVGNCHLIDTLMSLKSSGNLDCDVSIIFTPEHGFSGTFDAGKIIEEEEEREDSIKVVSLYGKNKKPVNSDIEKLDMVFFDLQDVGVRFYTYISTLHYVMQACAESGVHVVVLDRPNPHINYIDGPVLENEFKSFVGMHPVPIVYGMTIGEYAKMINGEGWLGEGIRCQLEVVSIKNYLRTDNYVFPHKPSPNLPNMRSILLYPSLCLFEGTVMSVGRGTDSPFQVVGHPNFKDTLFSFTPVSTPGASLYPKLEGEDCYGIDFRDINLDTLWNIAELRLDYLIKAYKSMPSDLDFFSEYFTLLAGTEKLKEQLVKDVSEKEIRATWEPGLQKFSYIRNKYLIYK